MRTKNIYNMDDKGLVNNPATRLPVCICLDTSYSMFGDPINELNRGLREFYQAIKEDDIAKSCAEISIITFGDKVECIQSFSNLDKQTKPTTVYAKGGTPMGEAVNLGLDLLEKRKEMYKTNGIDYFQPWLVLMTDGLPNGSYEEFKKAVDKTTSLVNNKKLTVFPIMIGKEANIEILKRFSPSRMPVQLKGLQFKEFFAWLSKSIAITSKSTPGDSVPLDPIADWAML